VEDDLIMRPVAGKVCTPPRHWPSRSSSPLRSATRIGHPLSRACL